MYVADRRQTDVGNTQPSGDLSTWGIVTANHPHEISGGSQKKENSTPYRRTAAPPRHSHPGTRGWLCRVRTRGTGTRGWLYRGRAAAEPRRRRGNARRSRTHTHLVIVYRNCQKGGKFYRTIPVEIASRSFAAPPNGVVLHVQSFAETVASWVQLCDGISSTRKKKDK